jgi:hypothetical protein
MADLANVGPIDTGHRKLTALQRPASALSSFKEDKLHWRGVPHTIIPELLHGAHTKKMLAANHGLPSIADHCLSTSLASIIPSAPRDNPWLGATGQLAATGTAKSIGSEKSADANEKKAEGRDSTAPAAAPKTLKSKALLVQSSKKFAMVAEIRKKMVQNLLSEESKEEQLRQSQTKIQTLQDHIKSLNALLAAQETSASINSVVATAENSRPTPSCASEQPCATNNSAAHTALVMRLDQLENSRVELKRQLMTFQQFAPVYQEILTIMGYSEGKQTAAQIVQTIEHLFEDRHVSSERILELQEKLEAAEAELKMTKRQLHVDLAGKASEINLLKNELEQQRGLAFQYARQKDDAIERKMHLESAMLQLKHSLKLLAEHWGCNTSLVVEAETFVALLSQAMIGKSPAQDALQAVQGVINTTWLEILHSRYPERKLPGDAITGIRMIYESMKALNQQNAQLSKNLKDARSQVSETKEELEKWRRSRASVTHLGAQWIFCSFTALLLQ